MQYAYGTHSKYIYLLTDPLTFLCLVPIKFNLLNRQLSRVALIVNKSNYNILEMRPTGYAMLGKCAQVECMRAMERKKSLFFSSTTFVEVARVGNWILSRISKSKHRTEDMNINRGNDIYIKYVVATLIESLSACASVSNISVSRRMFHSQANRTHSHDARSIHSPTLHFRWWRGLCSSSWRLRCDVSLYTCFEACNIKARWRSIRFWQCRHTQNHRQ